MTQSNIRITQLSDNDLDTFKELVDLFKVVFEHEDRFIPEENYLRKLLARKDFVVYVVHIDNRLIGGLTAYELRKYYSEESEFFIYDIAIRPEHQRKGLGRKLISAIKNHGNNVGIKEIFVAADADDKQAVDFYHTTGAQAEKVVHFNYLTE